MVVVIATAAMVVMATSGTTATSGLHGKIHHRGYGL